MWAECVFFFEMISPPQSQPLVPVLSWSCLGWSDAELEQWSGAKAAARLPWQ